MHAREGLREALERFEPNTRLQDLVSSDPTKRDLSKFTPRSPTIAHAFLNLAEVAAVRANLMRPAKLYSAWVDEGRFMRGSEQDAAGFEALRDDHGIDTVIDLRYESDSEAKTLEALGMTPVFIPVFDQSLPSTGQVQAFHKTVKTALEAGHKIYIHCEQGVGRTGLFSALYQIAFRGDSLPQVLAEAKRYGMNSAEQLGFVKRYYTDFHAGRGWTVSR